MNPITKIELIESSLKEFGETRTLNPKTKIMSPQISKKVFFLIKSGCLQQYYLIKGKKHVFRLIETNELCESITTLRGDHNDFEYIETITDVTLIEYDYEKVIERVNQNLQLSNIFREVFEEFLYFQEKRIQNFLALNPKERYLEFVKKEFLKFGKFQDNIIASYLGITKESFSRFRNRKS